MKSYKNFVNGKLVKSVSGREEAIISPVDERTLGESPDVRRRGRGPRRRRRRGGVREMAGLDAGRTQPHAPEARRRHREERRRARGARGRQRRQADRTREERGPVHGGQSPLLRGRLPVPRGQGGRGVPRRLHEHDPAGAGRRRGIDRALELPAHDGDLEDRTRARGREHGRSQALRADAADDAATGGARRGRLPARRLQRDHRPWRARRRAAWSSTRASTWCR